MAWLLAVGAGVGLALLLFSEHCGSRTGIYVFKPLTSMCFIGFALARGACESPYGRTLLVGQGLCVLGDVLLMLPHKGAFLAGIAAFLAGHIGYIAAFRHRLNLVDVSPVTLIAILMGAQVVSFVLARKLLPPVSAPFGIATRLYAAVIALMVCAAFMCTRVEAAQPSGGFLGPILACIGAVLFYISDLTVARERFVKSSPMHAYLGLPLYYAGQMLLAASVQS